ncbi:hypothetical protein [Aquabacterium sp. J223]|uniref:hypothetical protein n=1 Tax=Aquabacterium sp. J223 TaxID=2898431 RepID=UPI0021AD939F|nr:hypothetical protein [Aquabacterium sp. J223]UUX97501.1 hypothetical protein LRS07_09830 [Aquabacterium sp. J223]
MNLPHRPVLRRLSALPAASLLALAGLVASGPAAAQQVGVSVGVSQPGFYGQINIGNAPPPPVALIYPQPVLIAQQPVVAAPMYLHVPPGHAKKWSKHCHKYNACARPVYFVQETYYQQHYAPQHAQYAHPHGGRHGDDHGHGHKGHGKGHGEGKGKGRDKDRD